MNMHILTPEVQRFLTEHEHSAPSAIALAKSPFPAVSAAELAQQLDGRQRCRKKLPLWHSTPGIYYPEKLAIEQASSQITATHKAAIVAKGSRVIDLTGGFGVDTLFLAQRAATVTHCETNAPLSQIARHNTAAMGLTNCTFIAADGMEHLRTQPDNTFDVAYIDPSRRVAQRKVFRLQDCVPDVVALQGELLRKVPQLIIKSAPLLDITAALEALESVSAVHIVSSGNECKELLFVMDRGHTGEPQLVATALTADSVAWFAFTPAEELTASPTYGAPTGYLHEPDAALLKSGAFKLIGTRYGLDKLHRHTHLYTAREPHDDFMGKIFRITDVVTYGAFKKAKTTYRGNVSTRNFPLKAEELRKRHRISEGGDQHLFFCTGAGDELLVIFASKC
ncbi:class I SAM-dependent methyltransferase [Parapedobacter soli]|uniref:class I SAM-dependent methyltransferase n=1 Tax=Parapedobacter soli TaxID=416955 RepID=UPI0021CAA5F2|nr:class I SAM-dependent methyltransferase [Parapedobacter soli]